MTPSRWSTILRRVTTEGPYINEQMSVLVLSIVVVAGISAVAFADKSVASNPRARLLKRRAGKDTSCTAGPLQSTESGQTFMLPGTSTQLC